MQQKIVTVFKITFSDEHQNLAKLEYWSSIMSMMYFLSLKMVGIFFSKVRNFSQKMSK